MKGCARWLPPSPSSVPITDGRFLPDKIVVIGREKDGDVKMSIRSKNHNLQPVVAKALVGVEGYGGGHEHACGTNVKRHDFDRWLGNFREEIANGEKISS